MIFDDHHEHVNGGTVTGERARLIPDEGIKDLKAGRRGRSGGQ